MKAQKIRDTLPSRLRYFRHRAGLTAREVEDRVHRSFKTILGWERGAGQPDADALFELAKAYGIKSMDEFFTDDALDESRDDYYLRPDEQELIRYYKVLNANGRNLALTTVRALTGNPTLVITEDTQTDTEQASEVVRSNGRETAIEH